MALKTTRWSPDTCKCIIEYEWDTDHAEDVRQHSYKNVVSACSAHAAIVNKKKIHDDVTEENVRKNKFINQLAEDYPHLRRNNVDEEGNITGYVPHEKKIAWSFDENRKLKVVLTEGDKISESEKTSFLTKMKAIKTHKFDKVDIE